MRYGVMFIETETFWQQTSERAVQRGSRWNVIKSDAVEFETDSLDTAKNIAIGFARFFTDTAFPVSDWQKSNHFLFVNKQKFPTYDETGFMESELTFGVRLICFDLFEQHRRK